MQSLICGGFMDANLLLPFRDDLIFSSDEGAEPFILTEADKASGILAKRANQGTIEAAKTITIRMSSDSYRFVEVAAARAESTSRNEIINQLLRAGMQAAWERMNESERNDFLNDLVNWS